ncbi:DNA-directed RNA polymerase subunit alpha [bacterium]|nr:DNA-directed RNA polymerase subunit alpha [bacterium]
MRARWRGFELPTRIVKLEERTEGSDTASPAKYAKFIAEPFERGFGITVGNSLRRVLLSSLEGAAVTTVKIEGVQHEFSSLPGIVEDVTDIVLNVKQLLVKVRTDEPRKIKIDVKRKGTVTGADIQVDSMVEVVNPNLVIATLSEEVPFRMEMEVRRGRGYVTAEENDSEDREIGVIPIDSIYSPVRRVRYRTENTRVGQLTDYDKLILEIWTNNTIDPENALVEAAKILRKHLIPFVNFFEIGDVLEAEAFEEEETAATAGSGNGGAAGEAAAAPAAPAVEKKGAEPVDMGALLAKKVADLDLPVRALAALEAEKIATVGDLVTRSEDELGKSKAVGKTVLKEIKKKLEGLGLTLGMSAAGAGK